ncbi:probable E3 ubiquitin-protein ligase MGRN1 isoform X2 [Phlebotomus argentipes]|uniref:probable E3 ubiquitin-protein ligase MGRN1 isoform X2 n=1 Tax=Phlebotomus argentipes TaxID=94469 RepID=UPI002892981F|nr:probable E3 ubiquitin-protein ligase MGRN1 isoform X2 [Phlebotomus argentipes]
MGAIASRQNATVEEADIVSNHYKYPPRSGTYFGSHFIMGGERFDTPQPESYLFGENGDLNFLGNRPTPVASLAFQFPYPPPQANEPTKTLKCLVNIRKESIRFVKADPSNTKIQEVGKGGNAFNVEFTFDSDAKCAITIYYFCTEEVSAGAVSFLTRDSALTSETYHFKRGVNQLFSQPSHVFSPSIFSEDDLAYNSERDVIPIAIHCVVEEGVEEHRQSHTTICVVDHHTDGTYVLRALKQKIFVDGLSYLLQEIYGIENKNINKSSSDDENEGNSECVICMSDGRDTLILPCRHLCLCNSCADSLRYQANNCPICRAPFKALLQIRAVQKNSTAHHLMPAPAPQDAGDNIPNGYMAVALIEALNGPPGSTTRHQSTGDGVDGENTDAVQAAEILNRSLDRNGKNAVSPKDPEKQGKDKGNLNTPEFRMSVLMSKEDNNVTKELLAKHSPLMNRAPQSRDKNPREKGFLRPSHDNVKVINEKNATPENDDDSETERLSPLLNTASSGENKLGSALHIDGVEESIDDTDTDVDEVDKENKGKSRPILNNDKDGMTVIGAEDSDYYTPEDPHTTILSPLYSENGSSSLGKSKENLSTLSTPVAALKEAAQSLPDSPISGNSASTRSSGDSYSSSSSTKQLLASVPNDNYSGVKVGDKESSQEDSTP